MDINTPADKIRAALGIDVSTPPFAVTAASLMCPTTGQRGGRVPTGAYAANAAITITPGVFFITKGTAAALTLASPRTNTDDGLEMTFISTTAAAHTITLTAGFGGGTTSRDVATFGGAINDSFTFVAYQGVWYPKSATNITIA